MFRKNTFGILISEPRRKHTLRMYFSGENQNSKQVEVNKSIIIVIQWKLLKEITLGWRQTDSNNQLIIICNLAFEVKLGMKQLFGTWQSGLS